MNRLDRRLRLYHGRLPPGRPPGGVVEVDGPRERCARQVRGALRVGRPVIVRHVRWSALRWWLDDLAVDLRLEAPTFDVRRLDVTDVGTGSDTWVRVPEALSRCLGVPASFPAMAPTSREAFRMRAGMVLRKARARRNRKVVYVPGADLLGFELLQDLCDAWRDARDEMTPGTAPLLVLACRIGGQSLELADAVSQLLHDPSPDEAEAMLAELLGAADPLRLADLAYAVGPVPAFLEAVGRHLASDPDATLEEALAPLRREVAEAVRVAAADDILADRLERLASDDALFEAGPDNVLLRSGLVTVLGQAGVRRTQLRSPLIRQQVTGGGPD